MFVPRDLKTRVRGGLKERKICDLDMNIIVLLERAPDTHAARRGEEPHTCTTPSHPCTTFREHLWKVSEAVVRNPPCKAAVTFTRPVERHERPQKDELTSVARVERLRVEGNRDWTIHHHVIKCTALSPGYASPPTLDEVCAWNDPQD
ncbi:hypothetical protein O3P69_013432 [Scylla paramamosain]|uniref:Uncharacterized protein n=1 Tax=Scylla paramamosain TaxID=85552 RepID=A0AAW0U172_SCYPA